MISDNNSPEVLHQGSPTVLSLLYWMFENIKRHLTSQTSNLQTQSLALEPSKPLFLPQNLHFAVIVAKTGTCFTRSSLSKQQPIIQRFITGSRSGTGWKRGWMSEREEKGKLPLRKVHLGNDTLINQGIADQASKCLVFDIFFLIFFSFSNPSVFPWRIQMYKNICMCSFLKPQTASST